MTSRGETKVRTWACYGNRCKSIRGILFHNLNGCLVSEERNGNQAHNTAKGLLRLGFHGSGDGCLTSSVASWGVACLRDAVWEFNDRAWRKKPILVMSM